MIVPRPSLILLAAVTVIPLAGLAVGRASLAPEAVGILFVLVLLATGDAIWGSRRVKEIHVSLPAQVRWIQGREAGFEAVFETAHPRALRIRAAFAFPLGIEPVEEELICDLPGQAGKHYLSCRCLPRQRGLFEVAGCYYETASPLRLWDVRNQNTRVMQVRVYPNLEAERRQVASIFLRTRHSGSKAVRQLGQGRDFEKLREYVPGDGFENIHWKATARRGQPITKTYQIEKTQEIYVVIDASRLSSRLVVPEDPAQGTHLDRYLAATLVLGLAAEKQGDLFGLVTFSNRVLNFVRARNGREHYGACREALYRLEPQIVSPDYDEVASFIRVRLRRRALLVFMTDLDDPVLTESFQRAADLICRKHLLLVHMLQPGNIVPVFSNPAIAAANDLYGDLARHLAWQDLRQLTLSLQQHGVALSLFSREQFSAETVSNYLRVKNRQLL